MKRCVVILALVAGALLASATSASAATWNVWPGHSIQRAIRHASRGDTIVVHHGTYRESLTIRKSHLTLLGDDVTLRQPAHPRGLCGLVDAPKVDGICVIGGVDFATGAPIGSPVRGTHITGFHIKGFSGEGLLVFHAAGTRIVGDETANNGGDGLFMFHVAGSRIVGNEAANNGGYGIAGFVQRGGAYLRNSSHGNAEPGFYLGDSPHADYVIAHNKAWDNQYGIFIRHSAHGVVHNNRMWGNCVGALLLDDGEADGLHDMVLWHNRSWANDKACPPDDEGGPAALGHRCAAGRCPPHGAARQPDYQQRSERPKPSVGRSGDDLGKAVRRLPAAERPGREQHLLGQPGLRHLLRRLWFQQYVLGQHLLYLAAELDLLNTL